MPGNEEFLRISGITGGWPGCDGVGGNAISSPRLNSIIDLTDGAWVSICDVDWFGAWAGAWIPDNATDCDDNAADVNPWAEEVCDGIDNDCDGIADEDDDGDGATVCDGDCDDFDPAAFPGALEICDGIDNDCDGLIDGADDEVLLPVPMTDNYFLTYSSFDPLFSFCGTDYDVVGISDNGFVVPDGTVLFDSTPAADDMGLNAPLVAGGWIDLDPSQHLGNDFMDGYHCFDQNTGLEIACGPVWLVNKDDALVILWDQVAVDVAPFGSASFLIGLTLDDEAVVQMLSPLGDLPPGTRTGFACADGPVYTRPDPAAMQADGCVDWDTVSFPELHFAADDALLAPLDPTAGYRLWTTPGTCP